MNSRSTIDSIAQSVPKGVRKSFMKNINDNIEIDATIPTLPIE